MVLHFLQVFNWRIWRRSCRMDLGQKGDWGWNLAFHLRKGAWHPPKSGCRTEISENGVESRSALAPKGIVGNLLHLDTKIPSAPPHCYYWHRSLAQIVSQLSWCPRQSWKNLWRWSAGERLREPQDTNLPSLWFSGVCGSTGLALPTSTLDSARKVSNYYKSKNRNRPWFAKPNLVGILYTDLTKERFIRL